MAWFPGTLYWDTVSPRNVRAHLGEKDLSSERTKAVYLAELMSLCLQQNKCDLLENLQVNQDGSHFKKITCIFLPPPFSSFKSRD